MTFPSKDSVIFWLDVVTFQGCCLWAPFLPALLEIISPLGGGLKFPTDPQLVSHAAFSLCPCLFAPRCSSLWKAPISNLSTFFLLSIRICGHRQQPSSLSLELAEVRGWSLSLLPVHLTKDFVTFGSTREENQIMTSLHPQGSWKREKPCLKTLPSPKWQ